jgi:hypothetical protein
MRFFSSSFLLNMMQLLLQPIRQQSAPLLASRSFSSCPFQTLGLKNSRQRQSSSRAPSKSASVITYEQVRSAYRKLALVHHPDTADKSFPNGSEVDARHFNRIKDAFDAIVEGPGGMAVLRDPSSKSFGHSNSTNNEDANSSSNLHHETNHTFLHPSLNPSILREVAQVADMSPGGLDRGGMWQYASMVRNMAEEEGLPPLQVGGDVEEEKKTRRRRRK